MLCKIAMLILGCLGQYPTNIVDKWWSKNQKKAQKCMPVHIDKTNIVDIWILYKSSLLCSSKR